MTYVTYQFYWKKWWRLPWHHKIADVDYVVWHHCAGVGPLQIKWYSALDPAFFA